MTTGERVSQFIRDLRLQGETVPQQFNRWLATLPSTNFQVLVSAALAMSTAVVYYAALLNEISIDSVNFIAWLGFVAAYGGIAYKQFSKKRDSVKPELLAKQEAAT